MSSESDALRMIQEIESSLMSRIPEHKLRPRLEPTRRAVELLGDPQRSYRVIHITGTNGKTSTSRIVERILREHGLRTGRFTSPHLINLNERIALDGEPISNEILYEVFKDIEPVLDMVDKELLEQGDSRLTFFEALAVLAFAAFADAPIDVLVLEVGMGGAWDSTNVADGDVAVFTPIDLDHQERLGQSITEIAETKSGIIKSGAAVVSAVQPQEALEVLERVSNEIGDTFRILGQDFTVTEFVESEIGITFSVQGLAGTYENLFIPLHGAYQAANAAVAIAAVEEFLGSATSPLSDIILRSALADVSSPGRLQVISKSPRIILDAAHNPHGAASLASALENSFGLPHVVGVVSILSEKDAEGILKHLETVMAEIIITKSTSVRAADTQELAAIARAVFGEDRVSVEDDFRDALSLAEVKLPPTPNSTIVVTGTVSLIGDVLKFRQIQEDSDV
jgi:dihydrofolate synthase/folylpolyglutamate synthase